MDFLFIALFNAQREKAHDKFIDQLLIKIARSYT